MKGCFGFPGLVRKLLTYFFPLLYSCLSCAGRGPASARGNVKGSGKIFACLSGARVRAMWRVGSRTEQCKRKLGQVVARFSRQRGKRP